LPEIFERTKENQLENRLNMTGLGAGSGNVWFLPVSIVSNESSMSYHTFDSNMLQFDILVLPFFFLLIFFFNIEKEKKKKLAGCQKKAFQACAWWIKIKKNRQRI